MRVPPRTLRSVLGAVVALLLLSSCIWMLWPWFVNVDREAVTLFDPEHPELSRHDSRHAQWMAQWERVSLANIPWQRMGLAQQATVGLAGLPWVHDGAIRHSATVPMAQLPTIKLRRVLRLPEPVRVDLAVVPWGRDVQHAAAHLPLAELPRLRPRRTLAQPEAVAIPVARLPWPHSAGRERQK